MWRGDEARRIAAAVAAVVIVTLVAAACGDGDTATTATTTSTTVMPTTLPSEAALANADGELTTALGTFPLRLLECRLDTGGALRVVAETEDGAGRLEVDGTDGAATITFTLDHGGGNAVVWTVTEAVPDLDGSMLGYRGPSQVTGREVPETRIDLRISC